MFGLLPEDAIANYRDVHTPGRLPARAEPG